MMPEQETDRFGKAAMGGGGGKGEGRGEDPEEERRRRKRRFIVRRQRCAVVR